MASIVVVHGTGVREAGYRQVLGRFTARLAEAGGSAATVVPCLWGPEHGARLRHGGRSLPDRPAADVFEIAAVLDDYRAELRELALIERGRPGAAGPAPARELAGLLRELPGDREVLAALAPLGLTRTDLDAATAELGRVLVTTLHGGGLERADLVKASARALEARLALVLDEQWDEAGASLDSESLEPLRNAVLTALGEPPGRLGLGGRMLGALAAATGAERLASWRFRAARPGLTEKSTPPLGDILRYQARGNGIRDAVAAAVADAEPPVVLVAHSLGGVASVDLLIERDLADRVSALVTFASQAPFLYEIDALVSLRADQPLPAHFPARWFNAFDPRDPLGYAAEAVFGPDRVTDRQFDTGRPLLRAHTALWDHRPFYDWLVKDVLG
ncbi:hypothetical protein ACFYNO_16300 [Kitasatospora sp. NPDC006697]|uniref:hypothetical protein n=1 Tax=Kitasatospora sp. NPDC006697 TaxID=3364020 RepID=UPI0036AD3DC3